MRTVDSEKVWQAFAQQFPVNEYDESIESLVRAMPDVLREDLSKKVNYQLLVHLASKMAMQAAWNYPPNHIPFLVKWLFRLEVVFNTVRIRFSLRTMPEEMKTTEGQETMLKAVLSEEAFAVYKSGGLTVEKLMLIQPQLLIGVLPQ